MGDFSRAKVVLYLWTMWNTLNLLSTRHSDLIIKKKVSTHSFFSDGIFNVGNVFSWLRDKSLKANWIIKNNWIKTNRKIWQKTFKLNTDGKGSWKHLVDVFLVCLVRLIYICKVIKKTSLTLRSAIDGGGIVGGGGWKKYQKIIVGGGGGSE